MKAVVNRTVRDTNSYTVKTENDLAVAFRITDRTELRLGDEIEIDLPRVLETKTVRRIFDSTIIAIALKRFDIHDLRTAGGGHGRPSQVTDERMQAR